MARKLAYPGPFEPYPHLTWRSIAQWSDRLLGAVEQSSFGQIHTLKSAQSRGIENGKVFTSFSRLRHLTGVFHLQIEGAALLIYRNPCDLSVKFGLVGKPFSHLLCNLLRSTFDADPLGIMLAGWLGDLEVQGLQHSLRERLVVPSCGTSFLC